VPRVVHFEIHADNPERAAKFYTQVFGWEIKKWEGPIDYWLVMTGKDASGMQGKEGQGIDGGLMKRQGPSPAEGSPVNGYVCTVEISSIDEYVDKIKNAGGSVVLAKNVVPGVGWMASCKDTEGNIFGLMQPDLNAK